VFGNAISPFQGLPPEKPSYLSLAVSPDGRWILLDQMDLNTGKIMLVENFRW
jgi:hypothetical protein